MAEHPSKIDTSVPHSARIWNYWLGGKDNYPVDRAAGDEYRQQFPHIETIAKVSRHFLARTVRYMAREGGIRQFLDVGTGLPTADNTHQIAQRVAPNARIVYVDNDPLVLMHARALLTSTPEGATEYLHADLHEPETILSSASRLLDFSQPTGLILSDIMGHVSDDEEARQVVRQLTDGLASGSYLMLSHGTASDEDLMKAQDEYNDSGAVPYVLRTPAQIRALFDGLELVEPGVVPLPEWRPEFAWEDQLPPGVGTGGLAIKP